MRPGVFRRPSWAAFMRPLQVKSRSVREYRFFPVARQTLPHQEGIEAMTPRRDLFNSPSSEKIGALTESLSTCQAFARICGYRARRAFRYGRGAGRFQNGCGADASRAGAKNVPVD